MNWIRVYPGAKNVYDTLGLFSKKAKSSFTRERIFSDLIEYEESRGDLLPYFPEMNIMDLVISSSLNPEKKAGLTTEVGVEFSGTKKQQWCESYLTTAADKALSIDEGKEIDMDTSVSALGGRIRKKYFKGGIPDGEEINVEPRAIWMVEGHSEIMTDRINDYFIRYCKKQDFLHPVNIGKTMSGKRWINFSSLVEEGSQSIVCDASKFDSSISQENLDACFMYLRSLFPVNPKWDEFWKYIWSTLVCKALRTPDGKVFLSYRGLPSGHKFTSLGNTLCMVSIIITCLKEILGKEDYQNYVLNFIGEDVPPIIFGAQGDDLFITSTKKKYNFLLGTITNKLVPFAKENLNITFDDFSPQEVYSDDSWKAGVGFEFLKTKFDGRGLPTVSSDVTMQRAIMTERQIKSDNWKDLKSREQCLSYVGYDEKSLRRYVQYIAGAYHSWPIKDKNYISALTAGIFQEIGEIRQRLWWRDVEEKANKDKVYLLNTLSNIFRTRKMIESDEIYVNRGIFLLEGRNSLKNRFFGKRGEFYRFLSEYITGRDKRFFL